MARTPLMRALQGLAREHDAAARLGIGVDELHERQHGVGISRREFLKRTGAVGAAVAVAGPAALARPARAAGAPRIAIVGGGIAGLTAALTLQDKGVYADVYESSSRLGGRMHSDWTEFGHGFWDNGQQAELCGELIDTNHKTILQLAQRFSLPTVDLLQAQPNGTTDTYWIFGADYPYSQASSDFQTVHNILQGQVQAAGYPTLYNSSTPAGQAFDKMTLYDWITQLRARRSRLADGRPAQRGLQRGVRRGDSRPVRLEPGLSARVQREPRATSRSTASRTSGTTSSAGTRTCRSRSPGHSRAGASTPATG